MSQRKVKAWNFPLANGFLVRFRSKRRKTFSCHSWIIFPFSVCSPECLFYIRQKNEKCIVSLYGKLEWIFIAEKKRQQHVCEKSFEAFSLLFFLFKLRPTTSASNLLLYLCCFWIRCQRQSTLINLQTRFAYESPLATTSMTQLYIGVLRSLIGDRRIEGSKKKRYKKTADDNFTTPNWIAFMDFSGFIRLHMNDGKVFDAGKN